MRIRQGARRGHTLGPPLHVATAHLLTSRLSEFVIVGLLPLFLFALCTVATPAQASTLFAGSAGAADGAAAGATTAEPLSPLGAQFANPAGLTAFTERAMGGNLGLAYGQGEVTGDVPAGYHADNEVLVPFLNTFLVIPHGRWTFGISSLGTSGARFDYGARPNLGVDDGFFSETGMFGVPIGVAWRASDTVSIGAQITPLYGSTHLRYSQEVAEFPGEATPFRFTVAGFGVQGMLGATWKPNEVWSVGVSVKPPGRVWADGDTRLQGGKQRVDLELEVPTEVGFGIARALGARWRAYYSLRFTDSSSLGTSYIRFQQTPSANSPYLPGARDEWRHAVGLRHHWSDRVEVLGGFSQSNSIVSEKGVSPASFDGEDWRLNSGLRWKGEVWSVDGSFAYFFRDSRRISAEDALVMPGEYKSKPAYLLSIGITKKF